MLELIREPPPGGAFRMGAGSSAHGAGTNGDRAHYAPRPAPSPGGGAASGGGLSWWQMGARTVRIPIGYVIVAGGLALALAVGTYLIGYSRAEANAESERRRVLQNELDMVDPLNSPSGALASPQTTQNAPLGGAAPTQTATRPPQPNQGTSTQQAPPTGGQRQQAAPGPAPGAGALERDPRVPGLNYWVIARLGPDEARRAASYLQASGVDVAVVETNSDKFREVIASAGFEGLSSPDAARLKSRILELGRMYRVQEKGPTDFSDMYARKFSGR